MSTSKGNDVARVLCECAVKDPCKMNAGFPLELPGRSNSHNTLTARMRAMSSPLTLHPLFSDHAVLPRDIPIPVSGRALPGQSVKVTLGNRQGTGRASVAGRWEVVLDAMPAGGPHVLSVSSSAGQLIRRNLMIGEVWLGAGGNDMALKLENATSRVSGVRRVDMPRLRVFQVGRDCSGVPVSECAGRWRESTPPSLASVSALGVHFCRTLLSADECAVGLIEATFPDSRLLAWMQGESLRSQPELQTAFLSPRKPSRPAGVEGRAHPGEASSLASGLFNAMIAPLARLQIRGVVWLQGEADIGSTIPYHPAFVGLIEGWRVAWQHAALPFLFVQFPACSGAEFPGSGDAIAALREAQALACELNGAAMVVAADVWAFGTDDVQDVRTVADRLALAALAITQGRSLPWSAPKPTGLEVSPGCVRIRFSGGGNGLRLRERPGSGEFQMAGADRRFFPAKVLLEGDTVRLENPTVQTPVAVRYGWSAAPELNLETAAGLPVAPFRTDDWPIAAGS